MLSVVTIAAGRHDHLARQLDGLAAGVRRPGAHVVVAMGDPQIAAVVGDRAEVVELDVDDGPLPLARARNVGALRARAGGARRLVFLDVDCIPAPGLVAAYDDGLDRWPSALLSGAVHYLPAPPAGGYDTSRLADTARPHPVRPVAPAPGASAPAPHELFWSLSFAVSADGWERIGGFCEQYTGYGGEDTDFGATAAALGIEHRMLGGAEAYHQWHPSPQPPLPHLADIVRNANLFHERWHRWPMLGWLTEFERLGVAHFESGSGRWVTT